MYKMEKANVIKSKSSNSAITTKSDNHGNKKSRSSAEVHRLVVKKRGVYVEKKENNVSIHNEGNLQDKDVVTAKPPPRPKPGQKRFLPSVLTILSKSTAGTQFPEKGTKTYKRTIVKRKADTEKSPNIKAKPKYISKILNDEMIRGLDQQKSLVLQYKNINNSPSNYSDSSHRTYEYSPKIGNFMRSGTGSVLSSEAEGVAKQILEGLKIKNKDVRIQEPVTQIEKTKNGKDGENGENDKQLYKFFVDLLETTFSVYNVNAEYDAAPMASAGSSKIAFEIDESVVKKLETRNSIEDDETTHTSNFYCVKDTEILGGKNAIPELCQRTKHIPSKQGNLKPKRSLKTQSFIYTKPNKKVTNPSTALIFPNKSFSKKAKKKTLINLFKEQLNMSYSDYKEPQTLFEALKVIARNKRKYQKAICFDVPTTRECDFQRPKIISSKKTKKNMKYDYDLKLRKNMKCDYGDLCSFKLCESSLKSKSEKPDYIKPIDKHSNRTLEVYGFDYDDDIVRPSADVGKEVLLNQHSLTSKEEFSFDYEPLINYRFTSDHIDMFDM